MTINLMIFRLLLLTILASLLILTTACTQDQSPVISNKAEDNALTQSTDPLNSRYVIDGMTFQLRDGHAEKIAAPGSASTLSLSVYKSPVYGNLSGNSDRDAAVILIYDGGGSGSFYYLAAVLKTDQGYQSSNAILLGDRITSKGLGIQHQVIKSEILVRSPSQPMSSTPDIKQTHFLTVTDQQLVLLPAEQTYTGWVTLGHEVRSFLPCDSKLEHWLQAEPIIFNDLKKNYQAQSQQAPPYTPLLMVLAGQDSSAPQNGFGADYQATFIVSHLLDIKPAGNCREDIITITTPLAGKAISSPLRISGSARGLWFNEGDFPVMLEDTEGNVIARSYVTAQGEWMTKEFVAFSGILEFKAPNDNTRGNLIFIKDNPSDRPELDDSTRIPVLFNH